MRGEIIPTPGIVSLLNVMTLCLPEGPTPPLIHLLFCQTHTCANTRQSFHQDEAIDADKTLHEETLNRFIQWRMALTLVEEVLKFPTDQEMDKKNKNRQKNLTNVLFNLLTPAPIKWQQTSKVIAKLEN